MAQAPSGFTFTVRGSEVLIDHLGRHATTLRGAAAERSTSSGPNRRS